jgi:hypothetical protein
MKSSTVIPFRTWMFLKTSSAICGLAVAGCCAKLLASLAANTTLIKHIAEAALITTITPDFFSSFISWSLRLVVATEDDCYEHPESWIGHAVYSR